MKEEELYEVFSEEEENGNVVFTEYDITASPNDFNIKTLFDFISSGIVKIPGFQRNYVWDINRASKLIESIIIGIPIPQIFLYQEAKNKFIVIDGQQRYMTIYYFMLGRFPKKEKRNELRKYFEENEKGIPEDLLSNNEYFMDFNLKLPEKLPDSPNPLNKENYSVLDEDIKTTFDLRTIRNVIIKENIEDDQGVSAIYEIFNRLNSGGINLKPQEIRTSLFHSDFYAMLAHLNTNPKWRKLTPSPIPDLHMKDIEIILRSIAILYERENYKPSMTKFLNKFSKEARSFNEEKIDFIKKLFLAFIDAYEFIEKELFYSGNNRFSITIFESIFYFSCVDSVNSGVINVKVADKEKLLSLRKDPDFMKAILNNTASTNSITTRLDKAIELLN
ncbi:MAG: DUF262 domain-containing protein [Sphaerochaetaceae bacterium]|nr:DUF262 domain-containing protein [Sphaerochaetaceae bacterium]